MKQSNQLQGTDDFQLTVTFKVSARNGRALVLRMAAILAPMLALAARIALWWIERVQ